MVVSGGHEWKGRALGRRSQRRSASPPGLIRRYVWHGDAGAKIAGVSQSLVAILAVGVGILGVTGVEFISSSFFRGIALAVGAVLLVAQLVLSEQWQNQADVLSGLRTDVADALPEDIRAILKTELEAFTRTGSDVREIAPARIARELRDVLDQSSEWTFQGGSGRWLRSATLPGLAKIRNRDVQVTALLIDPRVEDLCQQYVESRFFRRDGEEDPSDPGDPRDIQANVLATIYSLGWYGARTRVKPTTVLLDTCSPQRYDVGSTGLVITVSTRSEPAVFARNGSWFYEVVCADLRRTYERSPRIELPRQGGRGRMLYPVLREVDGQTVLGTLQLCTVNDGPAGASPLLDGFASPEALNFDDIAERVRRPH